MRSSILGLVIAALIGIVAIQPLVASDLSYLQALRRRVYNDNDNDVLKDMDLRDLWEVEEQDSRSGSKSNAQGDSAEDCDDDKDEGICCEDTPQWYNGWKGANCGKGWSCTDYATTSPKKFGGPWCQDGKVVSGFEWTLGAKYNYPENNCCACGKGKGKGTILNQVTCTPGCKNNGQCIAKNTCSCPNGYSGPTCEIQSTGLCKATDKSTKRVFLITFGSGSPQYSTKTPAAFGFSTSYTQVFSGQIEDGSFAFVNSVPGDFGTWLAGGLDHTGDTGGYMFLVNSGYAPGQVFNYTINNLCVGSSYELSAYLANLNKKGSNLILPDVTFQVRAVENGYPLLASRSTGGVPEASTMVWTQYGLSFVTPTSSVVLLMITNTAGGGGNDFAVDDIELRTCETGPATCPSSGLLHMAVH